MNDYTASLVGLYAAEEIADRCLELIHKDGDVDVLSVVAVMLARVDQTSTMWRHELAHLMVIAAHHIDPAPEPAPAETDERLRTPLNTLELSTIVLHRLREADVWTVGNVMYQGMDGLRRIYGIGPRAVNEIAGAIENMGLMVPERGSTVK